MTKGGKEATRLDQDVVGSSENRALEQGTRELKRVLGKESLDNEIRR
jgi:hypothetical protein